MMRRTTFRHALVVALALCAAPVDLAAAKGKAIIDRYSKALPLNFDGTLIVDNPVGSVTVIGTDSGGMVMQAEKISRGADEALAKEGRAATPVLLRGDAKTRLIQTAFTAQFPNNRWGVTVNYILRVPRTVHVRIVNRAAENISVRNISGNVVINNASANIDLADLYGAVNVDTINGNIRLAYARKPETNVKLSTVNGFVEVTVPRDSQFHWSANTLRGDLLTTLAPRGEIVENQLARTYRGYSNMPNGPRIETSSVMGPTYLLAQGTRRAEAQSVFVRARVEPANPRGTIAARDVAQSIRLVTEKYLMQRPTARTFVFQRAQLRGNLEYGTSFGNIFVGELQGNARMTTRAGEIIMGRVSGDCQLQTLGGPINVGEVSGELNARSGAGDVSVRAAYKGGFVSTAGGNIQIGMSGAPMTIVSGGGDITVRRALSALNAQTKSGDVHLTLDPSVKSQRLDANTGRGNIVLALPDAFAGDLDATVVTTSPNIHAITSDLPGLTITREELGNGRTRIRAVGKVGGGGQRVELRAEEGSIQIRRNRHLAQSLLTGK